MWPTTRPKNANGPGNPEAVSGQQMNQPPSKYHCLLSVAPQRNFSAISVTNSRRSCERDSRKKMQTAPEFPRPSRKQQINYLAKVTLSLSNRFGSKSSYFKEGRTSPDGPPTVPERHPSGEGMDPEGFEPSPVTLARYRAAITPRAHKPKLTSAGAKVRRHRCPILGRSFVLEPQLGQHSCRRMTL